MIKLNKRQIIKLIDCLDTDISLNGAIEEMKSFFHIQKIDILSAFSIYHVVVPQNINSDNIQFVIKKI